VISPLYTGPTYEETANQPPERDETAQGMGQEAFLKMFMAQVTNQNPLDPMDNTEYTAQLATFSQLEQLTKIAESMEGMGRLEQAMQTATALGYLGREVTLSGDVLPVTDGHVGQVGFSLEEAATVEAVVTDSAGAVVSRFSLGQMQAGEHSFQWDGLTSGGQAAPDGVYQVTLNAYDAGGEPVPVGDQTVTGLVTGYRRGEGGEQLLLLGDAALPVSEVLSVRQPVSRQAAAQSAVGQEEEGGLSDILKSLASLGGMAAALI
jgi:flagellar basal-body rod modification protein FlgD